MENDFCITPIGDAESIGLVNKINNKTKNKTKNKTTATPNVPVDETLCPSFQEEKSGSASTRERTVNLPTGQSHLMKAENKKPKKTVKKKTDDVSVSPSESDRTLSVLFAGTCLAKGSTLNENYDFIQFKMNDVFENWNFLEKKTYFVLKNIDESEQEEKHNVERLEKDKYLIMQKSIPDETMIDFIRDNKEGSASLNYDVIVLVEAHNLIEVFLEGNEEEKSLFDSDIKQLFEKIKHFYSHFNEGGIMVNIHYKSTDKTLIFALLEDFYTSSSIWSLDVHIFLLKVMNNLFSKLEPGIYQKQTNKNVEDVIQDCYHSTIEELVKIGSELLQEEGKNQKLVQKIDETYFGNSLEKNKSYFWEKAVFYSMTNLLKNVVKTEEED